MDRDGDREALQDLANTMRDLGRRREGDTEEAGNFGGDLVHRSYLLERHLARSDVDWVEVKKILESRQYSFERRYPRVTKLAGWLIPITGFSVIAVGGAAGSGGTQILGFLLMVSLYCNYLQLR